MNRTLSGRWEATARTSNKLEVSPHCASFSPATARPEPAARPQRRPAALPLAACLNGRAHAEQVNLVWSELPGDERLVIGSCPDCHRPLRVMPLGAPVFPTQRLEHETPAPLARAAILACEGPRWPYLERLQHQEVKSGGARGGACFLAPVAYWCVPCLRILERTLATLRESA